MREHYISAEGLLTILAWVSVFVLLGTAGGVLATLPAHREWALWLSGLACATSAVAAVLHVRCMLSRMARLIRLATGYGDTDDTARLRAVP